MAHPSTGDVSWFPALSLGIEPSRVIATVGRAKPQPPQAAASASPFPPVGSTRGSPSKADADAPPWPSPGARSAGSMASLLKTAGAAHSVHPIRKAMSRQSGRQHPASDALDQIVPLVVLGRQEASLSPVQQSPTGAASAAAAWVPPDAVRTGRVPLGQTSTLSVLPGNEAVEARKSQTPCPSASRAAWSSLACEPSAWPSSSDGDIDSIDSWLEASTAVPIGPGTRSAGSMPISAPTPWLPSDSSSSDIIEFPAERTTSHGVARSPPSSIWLPSSSSVSQCISDVPGSVVDAAWPDHHFPSTQPQSPRLVHAALSESALLLPSSSTSTSVSTSHSAGSASSQWLVSQSPLPLPAPPSDAHRVVADPSSNRSAICPPLRSPPPPPLHPPPHLRPLCPPESLGLCMGCAVPTAPRTTPRPDPLSSPALHRASDSGHAPAIVLARSDPGSPPSRMSTPARTCSVLCTASSRVPSPQPAVFGPHGVQPLSGQAPPVTPRCPLSPDRAGLPKHSTLYKVSDRVCHAFAPVHDHVTGSGFGDGSRDPLETGIPHRDHPTQRQTSIPTPPRSATLSRPPSDGRPVSAGPPPTGPQIGPVGTRHFPSWEELEAPKTNANVTPTAPESSTPAVTSSSPWIPLSPLPSSGSIQDPVCPTENVMGREPLDEEHDDASSTTSYSSTGTSSTTRQLASVALTAHKLARMNKRQHLPEWDKTASASQADGSSNANPTTKRARAAEAWTTISLRAIAARTFKTQLTAMADIESVAKDDRSPQDALMARDLDPEATKALLTDVIRELDAAQSQSLRLRLEVVKRLAIGPKHRVGDRMPVTTSRMLLDTHRPFRVYTTLLRKCLHLVTHRTIATKRDLYYRDVGLFRNQATVDNALEDIAASLGVRRGCLHVVAASRGLIAGAVVYVLRSGERVTVSEHDSEQGAMLPPPETIAEILPPPLETFVLIVEKEATFRSLLKLGFHHRFGPCILMTGRGYPDVATRAFVKRLAGVMRRQTIEPKLGPYLAKDGSDDSIAALPPSSAPLPNASPASRLPLYVLTDNDPHGIDIFLCYSRGSRSMAFDAASLACPDVQWLGLRTDAWYGPIAASWSPHPSGQLSRGVTEGDWEPDGVRQARSLPLTPQDRRKAVSCLAQVGLRQDPDLAVCRRDLSRMLFLQRKCEIQLFEDEALVQWLVRRLDLGLRPCGP